MTPNDELRPFLEVLMFLYKIFFCKFFKKSVFDCFSLNVKSFKLETWLEKIKFRNKDIRKKRHLIVFHGMAGATDL